VDAAHPVAALLLKGEVAPPRTFGVIGQIVLIEQQRQPVGGRAVASAPTREPSREMSLGGIPSL
jgi:hypothetical protein